MLTALGIDISVEKRGGAIYVAMLVVSVVGLPVGLAATLLAARVINVRKGDNARSVWCQLAGGRGLGRFFWKAHRPSVAKPCV